MRAVRWSIVIAIALIAAGIVYDSWRQPIPLPPSHASAAVDVKSAPPRAKWTGSPTCVGRACHGSIEPRVGDGCRQDEYTTISTGDPHANAYRVLFEKRSRDMAKLLGRTDGKAHEMPRCLACHATPFVAALDASEKHDAKATPDVERHRRDAEVAFGVGCESCHGPAGSWLHEHYQKDWKARAASLPREQKPVALEEPRTRAATCVQCHVGAPATTDLLERSVDHDLIAAGHPRMLFEFVAFNDALPPHWRTKNRDVTREWFEGQIATAYAALAVLEARSRDAKAVWPEFAEYDCFACHHDLKERAWRQESKRKPLGRAPWNSWNADVVIRLLEQHQLPSKSWRELRGQMESSQKRDVAGLSQRIAAARNSLDELHQKGKDWRQEATGLQRLAEFIRGFTSVPPDSWEAAEQGYFALRALDSATGGAQLERVRSAEEFRGFDPAFVSPREFDPAKNSKQSPLP